MKLNKKSPKKPLFIALTVGSIAIVASLVWYFAFYGETTDQNKETSLQQSKDTNKNQSPTQGDDNTVLPAEVPNESVSHEKEKELPQLYEGENANAQSSLTGSISTKSVAGDYLIIRNTINQFVDSGTCDLTLSSGNTTVRRSAEIIQNPSSSSCAGFDIPLSELRSGQWSIEIYVSSEGKSMTLKDAISI